MSAKFPRGGEQTHSQPSVYILFLNHVYYTSHMDIVSYPLVALCGMIVMLLDSSVSLGFFVDGVPMFVFASWVN